jgi:predicted transposase YdaD
MPPPTTPHNVLIKSAFGNPVRARRELALVLPAAVKAHLDLATLQACPGSFVDDKLRHAHADLLYRVQARGGGEALVYVLFEHSSAFDPCITARAKATLPEDSRPPAQLACIYCYVRTRLHTDK